MLNKKVKIVGMILFLFILTVFSCSTEKNKEQQIINFESDSLNYSLTEYSSKKDKEHNAQCNNYSEIINEKNKIEMYSVSIKDIVSILLGIERRNVLSNYEESFFYTLICNGKLTAENKQKIVDHLLSVKKMQLTKQNIKKEFLELSVTNENKINHHISTADNDIVKSEMYDSVEFITNADLNLLIISLNQIYNESFIYKGSSAKRYNFEIPIDKTKTELLAYLKEKYGISIVAKENKNIPIYQIKLL